MNFTIPDLPERTSKPRKNGLTVVMDKGLSVREAEDFISVSKNYTDIIKLGWATAVLTPSLEEKLSVYHSAGMNVCFGGTLFEIFISHGQFDKYLSLIDKYELKLSEVSDGSIKLDHKKKCEYIKTLSKKVIVVSEVGSKDANVNIPPYKWIELMEKEITAGAWKVIAEAREGGNVGVFESNHEVRTGLVDEILTKVPHESIIWEAPLKSQQSWFIKQLGSNANLGNIPPNEVIPLETLRLGLRNDTFHHFSRTAKEIVVDSHKGNNNK
ncbi:MAG: phosphosulfolactate synthase [Bacteroidetes bacterium RIFCSPLOWO2_02_FULL_36_8]|nr:MAG: phosphosulfolactate synthase [Bacteroidetes bacterium RIFCSPLOWO2_02_FULL_36_8]OFY72105.1 MAG: phosphosulfolactate synthase [Bacteroidetes bacterium RIFCSPLOWO2_12_FULL_37_12]